MDKAPTEDNAPTEAGLPPSLRFLKWLVIVLTLTMIGGVITVVGLIVTRLPGAMQPSVSLPDHITLPHGVSAQAITQGPAWYAIVTSDDRILIFERKTGALRQEIMITPSSVGQ